MKFNQYVRRPSMFISISTFFVKSLFVNCLKQETFIMLKNKLFAFLKDWHGSCMYIKGERIIFLQARKEWLYKKKKTIENKR